MGVVLIGLFFTKAAFVLASNYFRKCFFRKRVCLVVTENWVKLEMFSVLTIK